MLSIDAQRLVGRNQRYRHLGLAHAEVAMWRLVVGEAAVHPNIAELFYESGPRTTIHPIRQFLERHAGLEIDDYEYAVQLFLAMVRGEYHSRAMLNLIDGISEKKRADQARRAADQFLKIYATAEKT